MKMQLSLVEGFEEMADYYQVETDGDRCWVVGKDGRVLKVKDSGKGYQQYCLYLKSGKNKMISEHRLFAICFLENPENKEQVNHKDGVKSNNLISNLEWMTSSENMQHADQTGLRNILGEQNGRAKIKDSEIPLIFELRKSGLFLKDIGKQFGVGKAQICRILHGENRSQKQ
jgi:hypothetical protein